MLVNYISFKDKERNIKMGAKIFFFFKKKHIVINLFSLSLSMLIWE